MRIYKMTATFGKLSHETLTLKPGLNVISAPNEWGKSTWCAFLVNMLYGIDTRARVNGSVLPDKERYAPWSGVPMSGSIELCWNGRDITIERTSNARTPLGVFRAYETHTGLEVSELTGSNCGQMLLGVERSVFSRAGFIRLTDLPVGQDDALRRRLNNLVTTGDESGTADRLGQILRDLKNKCRSNRANGLIPEAEERRDHLRQQLDSLQDLQYRTEFLQTRQQELEQQMKTLTNHKQALEYARYLEDAQKLEKAKQAEEEAVSRQLTLEKEASYLPEGEEPQLLQKAEQLLQEKLRLQVQKDNFPAMPQKPEEMSCFADYGQVQKDLDAWQAVEKKKKCTGVLAAVLLTVCVLVAGISVFFSYWIAAAAAVAGILVAALCTVEKNKCRKQLNQLQSCYPGVLPENWLTEARKIADKMAAYEQEMENYLSRKQNLDQQEADLQQRIRAFAGEMPLDQMRMQLQQAQRLRKDLEIAKKETARIRELVQTLEGMTQPVEKPQEEDLLRYSYQQTVDILNSARMEMGQVQLKIAECDGQRQLQGHEPQLRSALEKEKCRIARLEEYYAALETAQAALTKAGSALQRRFAPKITKRTQDLFKHMTADRYERVIMADNLHLSIAAAEEDTVREAQRRSDGTVDQLYLALRLAVAEELTPDAPVVLDDALVRFDDIRLKAAMNILSKMAEEKQVILFTCQNRELDWEKKTCQ